MRILVLTFMFLLVLSACTEQAAEQDKLTGRAVDNVFALEISPRTLEAELGDHLGLIFRVTLYGKKEVLLELTEENLSIARGLVVDRSTSYGLRLLDGETREAFQEELVNLLNKHFGGSVVDSVRVYQVSWVSPQLGPPGS